MCRRRLLLLPIGLVLSLLGPNFLWAADDAGPAAGEVEPAASATEQRERIDRLIEQLGASEYHARQKAQSELAAMGFAAFEALSEAETHEDLEIATRARYLMRLMRIQWSTEGDPVPVREILEDYEFQDSENRLLRMRRLAALPDEAGIPALCRLVRFERSAVLSKRAAIELLGRYDPEEPLPEAVSATIKKHLGTSGRTAANWLRTTLRFRNDPEAAVEYLAELIESEKELMRASPEESQTQIISALIRLQVNWLKSLDRQEDAIAAMRTLIAWEDGDSETLDELVQWLIEQEAWQAVGEVAERFSVRFEREPNLRYVLAQAYLEQGKKALAEKTAQEAFELLPGNRPERLVAHLITAYGLKERGMFAWADREYRHVLANSAPGHSYTMTAYYGLSEMLHDQAEDLEAADVLREAVEKIEKHLPGRGDYGGRSLEQLRARMYFFYACHWLEEKDLVKQREYLDKALAADPHDIDVLIACYRLDNVTDEFEEKIKGLIAEAAEDLQQEISVAPDEAAPYNQYAWLIANTEGDYDRALKYSKRSLELSPDNGGFYDTLARCYYAKKEYARAVQTQTRAVELEPHSGQIRRQLALFEEKLTQHKRELSEQDATQKTSEESNTKSEDGEAAAERKQ